MPVIITCSIGFIVFLIVCGLFIILQTKNIQANKEAESLDELMILHEEILAKMKMKLNTANWLVKRKFIKKYGKEMIDAITQATTSSKTHP